MMRFHKKKGFTLLELMIVVIIMGILAGLALPRFIKATLRAKSAEAVSNLGSLRQAQWRYHLEYDKFTNVVADLDTDDPGTQTTAKFKYTIPTATAAAFSIKATYKADGTKNITIDQDGVLVKTGF